jgi:hypothetical protein
MAHFVANRCHARCTPRSRGRPGRSGRRAVRRSPMLSSWCRLRRRAGHALRPAEVPAELHAYRVGVSSDGPPSRLQHDGPRRCRELHSPTDRTRAYSPRAVVFRPALDARRARANDMKCRPELLSARAVKPRHDGKLVQGIGNCKRIEPGEELAWFRGPHGPLKHKVIFPDVAAPCLVKRAS